MLARKGSAAIKKATKSPTITAVRRRLLPLANRSVESLVERTTYQAPKPIPTAAAAGQYGTPWTAATRQSA
jgi:hypothetical protein